MAKSFPSFLVLPLSISPFHFRNFLFRACIYIADTGRDPQPLFKIVFQIIGYKKGLTKRTSGLVVVHPPVNAAPIENMSAIRQRTDLVDGAALGRGGVIDVEFGEFDDGEEFSDQRSLWKMPKRVKSWKKSLGRIRSEYPTENPILCLCSFRSLRICDFECSRLWI